MEKENDLTIMTLDAGGTNFIFSAIRNGIEIIHPIISPSNAHHQKKCLETIISGFERIKKLLRRVDAISFAFPGPANYELGIIEDLPNFKAFNGGVALGPMLEYHFGVPVFINNDGNLFAYGEALFGALPDVNKNLKEAGSIKQFKNLIGITLGTGFGCGIVLDEQLIIGDNSRAAEIHNTLNPINPKWNAEENVSTRAIIRTYNEFSKETKPLMPKEIAKIALGEQKGDKSAALEAFRLYGINLGASIANTLSLIDGLVVIGGGITKSWNLFADAMFLEINKKYLTNKNELVNRLSLDVFNLEDKNSLSSFYTGSSIEIGIPGTSHAISYENMPRTGIAVSKLGASKASALGAYSFALKKLNNNL